MCNIQCPIEILSFRVAQDCSPRWNIWFLVNMSKDKNDSFLIFLKAVSPGRIYFSGTTTSIILHKSILYICDEVTVSNFYYLIRSYYCLFHFNFEFFWAHPYSTKLFFALPGYTTSCIHMQTPVRLFNKYWGILALIAFVKDIDWVKPLDCDKSRHTVIFPRFQVNRLIWLFQIQAKLRL